MSDRRGMPISNGLSRPGRGVAIKPKNMKGTLIRLWNLTKGHRKGLGWILLLSAFASGAATLSPRVTGYVITAISDGNPIVWLLCCLIGLYLCDWLVRFLRQYGVAAISQRIIHHTRMTLFDHMRTLPLRFFDTHRHGELMSRLTNDIDNINTTLSNSMTMLLTHAFTILGIFISMVTLSPLLTLVSLVSVAAIFALTRFVTKRTRPLFSERQKHLGSLNAQVEESISGLWAVKAFCREEAMERDFAEKNEALCKTSIRALIWSGYLMPLMNVINNLSYLAIAVFSGILYVRGEISDIGLITSFLLYVRQFTRPFVEIASLYNDFQTAVAGAERVFAILDEEPEPADIPDALSIRHPKGDISLKDVWFEYEAHKPVLKGISVDIPAGTQVAIVGETGSGKTTIINLLTRFYDVTKGEITLDGHDLRSYKMEDLRSAFGVVLQDTALFNASIAENIGYGNEGATREDIQNAAILCGADGFIRRMPEGYDTVLEYSGGELSQGERQLLTIARAMLTDAPIMILDEATSSVDTVTEQKIRQALWTMCRGRTSFLIAHRLSTIRDCDLILRIENGRIAEQGTHTELMANNGRYAEMYRTQTGAL